MKNKIITFIFIIYILTFSILGIIFKDKEISFQERRKLETFPKFELTSEYVNNLDKYLLDHFPFRETFRKEWPSICKRPTRAFGKVSDGLPWNRMGQFYSIKGVAEEA